MKRFALLSATCALALSACTGMRPPAAPQGMTAYGLDTQGRLVTFGTDNAAASLRRMAVTGLPSGETLIDLDVRNTDNRLYAMSSTGKLYRLDPATGGLSPDGSSLTAGITPVAIDFNPAANRLRVFAETDRNFRLTLGAAPVPATSPAGTVTDDGTLRYVTGTANPDLAAAAYTNSFNNSATGAIGTGTTTTLYSIDAAADTLVRHSSAEGSTPAGNFSTLTSVGALGVDAMKGMTGFDIAGADMAYLSVSMGGNTMLYTVNLTTGAATAKSTVSGLALRSFALALPNQ